MRVRSLQLLLVSLLLAPASSGAAEALPAPQPPPVDTGTEVRVRVDSPAPGLALKSPLHQARVEGSAWASNAAPAGYDVLLAIDVSESTKAASGSDVDGDGTVGVNPMLELVPPGTYPPEVFSTDPQDTVLYAEIIAAYALLRGLDSERVRVGLLSFAGEVDPTTGKRRRIDQDDAWLEVPLTRDYDQVRRGLQAILARGAHGATNYAAAVRLAITELAALPGSRSEPRPGAGKTLLFLTDGMPTLPIDRGNVSDPGDVEAAVRAARVAHKAGITINAYAMGTKALQYPKAATEMARVTQGTYTPVQKPGDIILALQGVSFANVEDVVFTNLTTGELSTDVRLGPDGSFLGYVPVQEGTNRVRVVALASDGSRGLAEFDLEFAHRSGSDQEKALELEQLREMSKQLELRRERERVRQFRDQQRKELELRGGQGAATE